MNLDQDPRRLRRLDTYNKIPNNIDIPVPRYLRHIKAGLPKHRRENQIQLSLSKIIQLECELAPSGINHSTIHTSKSLG